ncbi:unnamed protein product [Rotaria sp. Silwood2]|nr:unnamed protein product [Rotaria sp. Silwood2]
MSYCALRQRNFKLALTKLNEIRQHLDLCQNLLIRSIYWNEIYCDVYLKRHQIQSSTSTLSSLLSTTKENILSRDYNELASICDDYLRRFENNEDENNLLTNLFNGDHGNKIAELIVKSVLLSMKYGSNEGIKRFSRLLQIVDLYPKTMDLIADKLQEIPCWMFFDCLYQITAYLDKPIALKLYSVIEQIVKLYSQSIVYPYKLSYETLQYSIQDPILKQNLELIQQELNHYTPLVNEFIEALNQLNSQQQFDTWSKELFHLLTSDSNTRDINKLQEHLIKFKQILFSDIINLDETNDEQLILSNTQDNNDIDDNTLLKPKITSIRILFKNAVKKEFNDLFGKNGELLSTISLSDTRLILGNISLKLKNIIQDKTNINNYSTWFSSTFRQQNLKKKSLIEHHIKIVGFDEKLLVLHSLRLPKRITIREHDENDYRFLIKAGKDIRQDQRIEVLFSIMNDLYDNDPNCNQSNSAHIAVRTYKVIPMSSKLGIIEWLDNTRPLKDLIEESYDNNELNIITSQGQHSRKF